MSRHSEMSLQFHLKKKKVTCLLRWVAGAKEKEALCSLLNEFDVKL